MSRMEEPMTLTRDPYGARNCDLLAEVADRAAELAGDWRTGSWKHAAVLVFATKDPSGLSKRIERADPDCLVASGPVGAIVLAEDVHELRRWAEKSPDLCLGVGHLVPVKSVERSCSRAMDALDFTHYNSAVSRAVSFGELGALTILGTFTSRDLANLPNMDVVSSISTTPAGRLELEAVEALCRTGSLRKSAELLNIHHSSVASRIRNVECELGYRLNGAIPLTTAYAAILGLRLLEDREHQGLDAA